MKLTWNNEKNELLKKVRGISFDEIEVAISKNKIIDIYKHPGRTKYPNQFIIAVEINDYIYLIPSVKEDNGFFLKTIIPSRKATKKYLGVKNEKKY